MSLHVQRCLCSFTHYALFWCIGALVGFGYVWCHWLGVFLIVSGMTALLLVQRITSLSVFLFFMGYCNVSAYWVSLSLHWFDAYWWEYALAALLPGVALGCLFTLMSVLLPWWRLPYGMRAYGFGFVWSFYNVFQSLMNICWHTMTDVWASAALPMVQIASLMGKDLTDMLLVLGTMCMVHSILVRRFYIGVAGAIILGVIYSWGAVRLEQDNNVGHQAIVRLVHTSMGLDERTPCNLESRAKAMERMLQCTDDARIEATILPEAFFSVPCEHYPKCMRVLERLPHHAIVGVVRQEGGVYFNSIARIMQGMHRIVYDKKILVPFGEYVPFRQYLPFDVRGLAQGGVDFGCGVNDPTYVCRDEPFCRLPAFYSMICYEGVLSKEDFDPQARWMLQVSNECWFFDSCARDQHWNMLCVRAIEVGRPILRATNWGLSGCIDAYGRTLRRYSGATRVLVQGIPRIACQETPYMQYWIWWQRLYWCIVSVLSCLLWIGVLRGSNALGPKNYS